MSLHVDSRPRFGIDVLDRARVLVAVARPPVLILLAMYAAAGFAAAGGDPHRRFALLPALAVVAGFLVFSVSLNDLADVEIDRVNLAGRPDRPLVIGAARRRELIGTAFVGGLIALSAAWFIGWLALAVCGVGLVLSAAYSLPPFRLAGRGAVASLLLPAGYVAVPYLSGVLSRGDTIDGADLVLLAALYVGFIGRILLKDFRDVRGDAMFGKRTYLVRHGRRATCAFSAGGWIVGSALAVLAMSVRGQSSLGLDIAYAVALVGVLAMLRALSVDRGFRRDELLVSGIAIVGRGQLLVLLVALSMTDGQASYAAGVIAALALLTAAQCLQMLRHGPTMRRTIPASWAFEAARANSDAVAR